MTPGNGPIRAWAASGPGEPLKQISYDPGPLQSDWVEVAVDYCGICHSDLSMLNNEWGRTSYPIVAGHEVAGRVVALGSAVSHLEVGDPVGIGWFVNSCMACGQCLDGRHNLCAETQATIIGRHGGFAERVRCHWAWATPLPKKIDPRWAGPLFCGGITVFSPLVEFAVAPTDRVGVVGVGGLGHLAIQFLRHWGCEVTAFSSSDAKADEARQLGAHRVVSSRDQGDLKALRGSLDFVLVTANVPLDWMSYLAALAPRGRLHFVGAVLEPLDIGAFNLIGGQKAVSGSPVGSPAMVARMLEFCARHEIRPWVEEYAMSEVNEAIARLASGSARYRVVLRNDFDDQGRSERDADSAGG